MASESQRQAAMPDEAARILKRDRVLRWCEVVLWCSVAICLPVLYWLYTQGN
jgi:hypothetical protein